MTSSLGRSLSRFVLWVVVTAVAFGAAGADPALAAKKTYEDKKLGFKLRIEDSYVQNPPKLTSDEAYLVGDWYEDAAKYDASYRPQFQVYWFVEPKVPPKPVTAEAPAPVPAPVEPGGETAGGEPPPEDGGEPGPGREPPKSRKEQIQEWRDAMRPKSFDEAIGGHLERYAPYYGPFVPMEERWKTAEKDKTVGKVPFEWFEVNPPTKRKPKDGEKEPPLYGFVARLTLDRPGETIHVGFFGSTGADVKRFRSEFPGLVRSFESLKSATDSRNELAQKDLASDPAERRAQVRAAKLIQGWKAVDTKNYILLHHDEVAPDLARAIGTQIEAIRAQVYEVLFPPDRPILDVCIVRVCKDRTQYMQYGGSGNSAGFWNPGAEELVFYEDQSNKKDSLRVLYHEAFHQYIHYSVGEMAPHSWFNEGHGDYFAGHNYAGGRFVPDVFQWRVSKAKEWKRNPKRPPLREWVGWTQMQYYGRNKSEVPDEANYALGWSLVYFLRTTKKPEYQGVLDRYFNSLKGAVTRARVAEESLEKRRKAAIEKGDELPDRSSTDAVGTPDQWLKTANEEAFKGIDWDKIEKDWLASDY